MSKRRTMARMRAKGGRPLRTGDLATRVARLENALAPFARFTHETDPERRRDDEILVPADGDVWLYVGKASDHPSMRAAPLHTNDFRQARRVWKAS